MRLTCICLLILSAMHCSAQKSTDTQYVKGKCFEGYIFPKTYTKFIPIENIKDRFTPQKVEILKAEKILNEQLTNLNKNLLNQTGRCPIIHNKLKKYKRQYIGAITENGDRVIWINFVWGKNKDSLIKWSDEIIVVLDGCSFYWNVKVNLTKEKLSDLSINGAS